MSRIYLIIFILLYLIGIYFLFNGFFSRATSSTSSTTTSTTSPLVSSSTTTYNDNNKSISLEMQQFINKYHQSFLKNYNLPNSSSTPTNVPNIDKIVLILIDALSFMQFQHQALPLSPALTNKKENFLYFTSYAHPPTVTLPKLRALVNGQMSNFLDVVFNIVSEDHAKLNGSQISFTPSIIKDSGILYYFKVLKEWNLVLHGDETWYRLVTQRQTQIFNERGDTTHSLVVTDTIIVDENVTRHIDEEINVMNDWNVLILHYLGLDHLGHIHANQTQFEEKFNYYNDKVFEPILSKININNTLFILASDHGMTLDGNHGGASALETNAVLSFIHSSIKRGEGKDNYGGMVNQIDFVPTISVLTGIPIPTYSVGKIILECVKSFGNEFTLWSIKENAIQLLNLMDSSDRNAYLKKWDELIDSLNDGNGVNRSEDEKINELFNLLTDMSENLIRKSGNVDYPKVISSLVYLLIVLVGLFYFLQSYQKTKTNRLYDTFIIILFMFLLKSYGSSSFIEEEHLIWYFYLPTILLSYFYFINNRYIIFAMLFIDRLTRYWNVSGIKDQEYAIVPIIDQQHYLFYFICLSVIVILQYIYTWIKTPGFMKIPMLLMYSFFWFIVFDFKFNLSTFTTTNIEFLYVYLFLLFISVLLLRFNRLYSLISFSQLWFLKEHIYNYPLICLSILQAYFLMTILKDEPTTTKTPQQKKRQMHDYSSKISSISKLLIIHIFAMSHFFKFGRSISVAAIDFSIAYEGISFYHPLLVGFGLFVQLFSPRIIFDVFVALEVLGHEDVLHRNNNFIIGIYQMIRQSRTIISGLILLAMQSHLFIWSVFSPKFLFDTTLETLYQVVVLIVLLVI
ncbi:hypothetical protein ABK040_002015 [Willaertia magna]